MFTLRGERSGGFPATLEPMNGEALVAQFNEGIFGFRPTEVDVDGITVPWATFKTIFNLDREG